MRDDYLYLLDVGAADFFERATNFQSQLDDRGLLKLFNVIDEDGNNLLMRAAGYRLEAVMPILEAVVSLSELDQRIWVLKKILTTINQHGNNALMLAARYQPEAVTLIRKAIDSLPTSHQVLILNEILPAKNIDGYDALILAIMGGNEKAVAEILQLLNHLSQRGHPEVLTESLKNTDKYGNDVLMWASVFLPAVIESILNAAQSLSNPGKGDLFVKEMLTRKNKHDMNAFMLAAQYNLKAISPILKAAYPFPGKEKADILTTMLISKNKYDLNGLMLAALYQPEAVVSMLAAISLLLEPEEKAFYLKKILIAKDNDGNNPLMLAVIHEPEAMVPMSQALNHLPEADRVSVFIEMLKTKNENGNNALMLAAKYYLEAVNSILKVVKLLPEEVRALILIELIEKYSAELKQDSICIIVDMYSVDDIFKPNPSFLKLMSILPQSPGIIRIFSLHEFIKPNRIPSAQQLQVVKNWFSSVTTSKEEKAALLRRKPEQVVGLILDKRECLEIKTLQLLSLLLPSADNQSRYFSNSDSECVHEFIQSIQQQTLSKEIKQAVRLVMQAYNRLKNAPLQLSRPGMLGDKRRKTGSDDRELDSFTPGVTS